MELFANGKVFIYLILTTIIVGFLWWLGFMRKKAVISKMFSKENYARLISSQLKIRRQIKDFLLLSGIFFLFIALAGLQWGKQKVESQAVYAQAVIAVDVSASMRAEDFKPNRLENAKTMLTMLYDIEESARLGLIAFTSQAYTLCPITTDMTALKELTKTLTTDMLLIPGTSLSSAVNLSAKMLKNYEGIKALVLISDGEDHSPKDIEEALKIARENKIKIITIGIGSIEGELIPEQTSNGKEYKKDKDGKTVLTKLDEKGLMNLASASGGAYIKYGNAQQTSDEIARQLALLDKSLSTAKQGQIYIQRYQIPLSIALVLLMLSLLVPLRKGTK